MPIQYTLSLCLKDLLVNGLMCNIQSQRPLEIFEFEAIAQGSSWALTVGRSDFYPQEVSNRNAHVLVGGDFNCGDIEWSHMQVPHGVQKDSLSNNFWILQVSTVLLKL